MLKLMKFMKAFLGFLVGYFVAAPVIAGLGVLAFLYWLFFI